MALLMLAGLFVGGALWSVGLISFARAIPDDVADENSATDAIVVLTGGSERLATGLRLLAEHKGERVFISGVHPGVPKDDLLRVAGTAPQEVDPGIETRIDTGHGARDTAGNAEETAAWMRRNGFRSLRLVTGSYHMPRSLLEFAHALPEARVIPNPVFPQRVHQDAWWRNPGTAALIISEYNKFLLAMARHQVDPLLRDVSELVATRVIDVCAHAVGLAWRAATNGFAVVSCSDGTGHEAPGTAREGSDMKGTADGSSRQRVLAFFTHWLGRC